ncbi:hypothetical protein HXX76_015004 [Chlamydomonas incerta]|uniref:Haem-binding uptake Tiki superfamily ChaN domain-containing protein n=1 Tax=Chlamydomonas incerta TaxID=51695 RepID=A0A835SK59_CHLIN|nr:hypothetical protein HXX76_015004 [Chlamydomonas incerta]|eukprot:KAG2423844.1 hypothetical protein HXX76_015004 [Chlamydomonas incerta]
MAWPQRLALQNERPAGPRSSENGSSSGSSSSSGSGNSAQEIAGSHGKGSGARPALSFREGSAYAVYDAQGEPSSWEALLASLPAASVVLLGEYHDDPVAHALQLALLRHTLGLAAGQEEGQQQAKQAPQAGAAAPRGPAGSAAGAASSSAAAAAAAAAAAPAAEGPQGAPGPRRPVALSLEMFEADVQHVIDEFLIGAIREADLMKDGRPWPNYPTDYRPLVMAAKEGRARVVCANAPRRYVSLVGRSGAAALEALPPDSRRHLPPLPLRPASDTYAAKIQWTMQRARQAPAEGEAAAQDDDGEERAAPLAARGGAASASAGAAAKPPPPAAAPSPPSATATTTTTTPSTTEATAASTPSTTSSTGSGECPYSGMSLGRTRFVEAQNLWDAGMAHAIAAALAALPPGGLVVHVCGKFHSEQRLGICEHLAHIWGGAASPTDRATSADGGAARRSPAAASQDTSSSSTAAAGEAQQQPGAGRPAAPRVCVVTFVPSGRGVSVPAETLRGAGLHTYGDWLVLTDGRLPRSFESDHPV